MTRTVDTTQELAAFLRSRREGLDPHVLGLPLRRQSRRTPGLRREEVAELAGVTFQLRTPCASNWGFFEFRWS